MYGIQTRVSRQLLDQQFSISNNSATRFYCVIVSADYVLTYIMTLVDRCCSLDLWDRFWKWKGGGGETE